MSGIRSIVRNPTLKGFASAGSAPIYVDSDDNRLKIVPAGSGTTELEIPQVYAPVTNTGNLSLTKALHSQKIVIHNEATGRTYTLPTATGSGDKYRIVVGVTLTGGSLVVAVADATDYMRGRALFQNDTDGSASNFETANTGTLATESDTITLNRTTTGLGTIGDEIILEDIMTDVWLVRVEAQASGTEATPFSAAV